MSGAAARLEALLAAGRLDGLHAVLALRAGETLLERYVPGEDWVWGRSLGRVDFTPDALHDLRSVTKSIVGLLYGIALGRGLVPPPEAPLLAQFPACADLAPGRGHLTIGHALGMTMGTDWNERLPYTDPNNSEIAMEMAPDRWRYILSRDVLGPAGEGWIYGGGAVALVGRLIEQGSGRDLAEFAAEALFAPLGITAFEWSRGRDGSASAASGLRLTARGLARIGQAVLRQGEGVIPVAWLAESFRPRATVDDGIAYGWLWYLGRFALARPHGTVGAPWMAGFGNGGQRLFVVPSEGLVFVAFCGNYDGPEQWRVPMTVLREAVLPVL